MLALAVMVIALIFSPTIIIPPANPADPVTVYVADYGFHSGLILPKGDGKLIRYSYGDWYYFALRKQDWDNALAALFLPTPATLGRQQFNSLSDLKQALGSDWRDILLSFSVSNVQVTQLLASLDERFQQNLDTRVMKSKHGLVFVQDAQNYTIFHNSNHEVVEWLEELNCQVKGFVMWPNFHVKEPQRWR